MHSGEVTFAVADGERFVPRLFAELGVPIRSVSVSSPQPGRRLPGPHRQHHPGRGEPPRTGCPPCSAPGGDERDHSDPRAGPPRRWPPRRPRRSPRRWRPRRSSRSGSPRPARGTRCGAVKVVWQREMIRFFRDKRTAGRRAGPAAAAALRARHRAVRAGPGRHRRRRLHHVPLPGDPGHLDAVHRDLRRHLDRLGPGVRLPAGDAGRAGAADARSWSASASAARRWPPRRRPIVLALAGLVGVPYDPVMIVTLLALLFLTALAITAFGLMISVRIKRFQAVMPIIQLVLTPMMFLSGSMFPLAGLPVWLAVLTRVNPLTYAVEPMRHTVFDQLDLDPATRATLDPGITWGELVGAGLAPGPGGRRPRHRPCSASPPCSSAGRTDHGQPVGEGGASGAAGGPGRLHPRLAPAVAAQADEGVAQVVGPVVRLRRRGQRPAVHVGPGRPVVDLHHPEQRGQHLLGGRLRPVQVRRGELAGGVRDQHRRAVAAPPAVVGDPGQHRVVADEDAVHVRPVLPRPAGGQRQRRAWTPGPGPPAPPRSARPRAGRTACGSGMASTTAAAGSPSTVGPGPTSDTSTRVTHVQSGGEVLDQRAQPAGGPVPDRTDGALAPPAARPGRRSGRSTGAPARAPARSRPPAGSRASGR